MPFTQLQKQDYAFFANALTESTWSVVCFCAEWCGSCRNWFDAFKALSKKYPDVTFIWIDIEDHADLLDVLDIENFPSLLIQYGDIVNFFGPIHPDAKIADRLLVKYQAYSQAERLKLASSQEMIQWQKIANIKRLFHQAVSSD